MLESFKVLLVEDNPGDAELLLDSLESAELGEFDFRAVSTAKAAVASLAERPVDLVLLDLSLPDATGLEALDRVREADTHVPVVVVSGNVDADLRTTILRAGAHEALNKADARGRLFALSTLHVIHRQRAEAERRRVDHLLDVSPDAIVVTTEIGEVKYVNSAAEALFNKTRVELLQERMKLVDGGDDPVELRLPRPGRDPVVGEMRLTAIDWFGEPATMASIRDVTEQRRMELQLLLSDRMVSLGTLAAGLVHEINNPLASVVANLELMKLDIEEAGDELGLPAPFLEELHDAWTGSDRLRRIVQDLKLFSRSGDDTEGTADPEAVLESSVRMAWNEIRHRARLTRDYGPVPATAVGESRLGQVVLNLLVNAAHAIEEGDLEGNEIRLVTRTRADGFAEIVIGDTGSGMSPQVQQQLFTPFFSTKPVGVGTGLGLAISRRIVEAAGGTLTFTSELGRGTEFHLALPPAPADLAASGTIKPPSSAPAEVAARVLIVDDDPLVIAALRRVLDGKHEVVAKTDPHEAIALLRAGRRYDVILSDVMMPTLSGEAFLEAVREVAPGEEQRVVFVTGGAFTASARAFLDRSQSLQVGKPFDVEQLRAIVRSFASAASRGEPPPS